MGARLDRGEPLFPLLGQDGPVLGAGDRPPPVEVEPGPAHGPGLRFKAAAGLDGVHVDSTEGGGASAAPLRHGEGRPAPRRPDLGVGGLQEANESVRVLPIGHVTKRSADAPRWLSLQHVPIVPAVVARLEVRLRLRRGDAEVVRAGARVAVTPRSKHDARGTGKSLHLPVTHPRPIRPEHVEGDHGALPHDEGPNSSAAVPAVHLADPGPVLVPQRPHPSRAVGRDGAGVRLNSGRPQP
mmetsp:Transcript_11509/g.34994  ORF Transcript_11509/g.34994 Transcript_11509/m.34994 type:complete len:240 (-) Transcript_11509:474-1193(-)